MRKFAITGEPVQSAVRRAIETMLEHYREPISLEELADAAILSRFYFSRIFREVTGTSPGRFLSAVRLDAAKNLLRDTDTSVTEISYVVGYNSTGTFTSRFTGSVGMAPTRYRDYAQSGLASWLPPSPAPDPARSTVHGRVTAPLAPTALARVYVGAFGSAIPEGRPVSCDVLADIGLRYRLNGLPDGRWHVRAAGFELGDLPLHAVRRRLLVGTGPTITARAGRVVEVDIELRDAGIFDPPVLLALPDLDGRTQSGALEAVV
jgi:AraC-like DNA-binding protein